MSFFSPESSKEKAAKKEVNETGFIPYLGYWNSTTLITSSHALVKIIKVEGFAFETADDEDVDAYKTLRNQLFKSISTGSFSLYFHTIRRREKSITRDHFFNKAIPNFFAEYIRKKWREKHISKNFFVNELYISVVKRAETLGTALFDKLIHKFSSSKAKENWESTLRVAHEELEEIITRIVSSLRYYSPKVLSVNKTNNGVFSEILGFLSKIINCGDAQINTFIPNLPIGEYLPTNRLYFGNKSIEIVSPTNILYGAIVSLKEYGAQTSAGMLDAFLQLPYELIITQTFQFTNKQAAVAKMQLQQNRLIQSEDKALTQIVEITKALDDATSGKVAFGQHHLSVLCLEHSLKALEVAIGAVSSELSNCGLIPVRESINLEAAFWGQIPGNFDYIVRKSIISTINLASFVSLHNYPFGSKYNNHWGDAVTVLDTTSGTPFFFSFHLRDVGHTTIIGPTGSGKTLLMNFLCSQCLKFRPRIFFFDKDLGAEIFIRAVGGRYTVIEPRTPSFFNPLQLSDTPDNRTFLAEWFTRLVSVTDSKLTAEDRDRIDEAIRGNYTLAPEDRILRNLIPFLGLEGPETLAGRIKMWHSEGSHASLFDNPVDNIDFNSATVFGFEMAHLLRDQAALGPVLLYLFHRINISLDGSPTMIVLDEAWALIDNPIFAPKIRDWLKVLRKLNTFVVFATQSVEDASKSAISDTLIQQTATQIFLPNLKATEFYRTVFMLSQREFVLIKTTDPGSRFFLIKQGINAVIARVDLKGMDDIINVLSGRAETVILFNQIIKEVGEDPKVWLPIFYEKVKNV